MLGNEIKFLFSSSQLIPLHWLSSSDLSQFLNQVKYSETGLKLHYWFTLWARIRSISCKLMVIDWLRRATWCTVPHNQSHSDVKAVVSLAAADLCQHECLPWNGDCKICIGVTIQLTDWPGSGTSGQVLIFDCKRTPSALASLKIPKAVSLSLRSETGARCFCGLDHAFS
jgi:hypothetical protein